MRRTLIVLLALAGLGLGGCSCETWTSFWGGDPEEKCASHWRWNDKEKEAQAEYNPCQGPSMGTTSSTYPTTEAKGRMISLEKVAPKEVTANSPFDYRIKVQNLTNRPLTNVMVSDTVSENIRITDASPKITNQEGNMISWDLGTLQANATNVIRVSAEAQGQGSITSCANVTFDSPICAKIDIVESKVRLVKDAPSEVLLCDRIPVRYVVTNTGSGYACDVRVEDSFEEGLTTAQGKNEVMFTVDSLAPGQSKEFNVMLDASQAGMYSSKASLISRAGGDISSNETQTKVTLPQLAVSSSGPKSQYLGREVTYQIQVSNKGDGMAKDTMVVASVPENISFKNATLNGTFTRSSPGKVTWNVGQLEPNETKTFTVTLTGQEAGQLKSDVSASAYCAETANSSVQTMLEGIPAVLLEVVDVQDPVEVGESSTYVITVTNQGTAVGTEIEVACDLAEGMDYVSSTGPTEAEVSGNQITFGTLKSLAPGAEAQWKINFNATGEGKKLFRTTLKSAEFPQTIGEIESTNLYEVK